MRLDVAEYGVPSAVETTSTMVKLAFKLSLVCETREVEVLESCEQGADTSRTHSLVIEVCERNVCVNEVSARRVKSLPWRKGVTSSVPLRRCV